VNALLRFLHRLYAEPGSDDTAPAVRIIHGDIEFGFNYGPTARIRLVRDHDGLDYVQYWHQDPATGTLVLQADWPANLADPDTAARTIWHLIEQVQLTTP
jgi:hypothetical protein